MQIQAGWVVFVNLFFDAVFEYSPKSTKKTIQLSNPGNMKIWAESHFWNIWLSAQQTHDYSCEDCLGLWIVFKIDAQNGMGDWINQASSGHCQFF